MDAQRRRLLLGRLPLYLLVVGLAVLTVQYFQERPVSVTAVYVFGPRHRQLQSASIVYLRGGNVVASARYSYRSKPAAAQQRHDLALPPGDYTVEIDLTYATPPGAARRAGQGDSSAHVVKQLRVESEGEYSLYLDR